MSLEGTVIDGQIIFREPLSLPNGTRVAVTPIAAAPIEPKPALGQRLEWLAGAIPDMPADFAAEHDHYIHGSPRRGSEG
jgi:hypothetical protein